ncbi:hypothetical protein BO82DRAFT_359144 [Aspergillus uvarum CBS 121591]|uniref:Uncharacterized protein n=1 Tax=Aspergillus uvarum CBS 121591 TaxID=1448315 RepID=A0A319BYB0_9EURO|nr:hypothetical protein BO82DRAFT_359144 [Aspergillus uvarum CBS 121591]PYH76430.1 hypothetical protein BO82DRAFT_359144 [Aspergillus uvarum CBS 121591]
MCWSSTTISSMSTRPEESYRSAATELSSTSSRRYLPLRLHLSQMSKNDSKREAHRLKKRPLCSFRTEVKSLKSWSGTLAHLLPSVE